MSLTTKLVAAIAAGRLDNELGVISATIAARNRALVETKKGKMKEGDTVVFNHRVRPKYLYGTRAKILARAVGKYDFLVELLDHTGGKFAQGKQVRVTAGLIDRLEEFGHEEARPGIY